MNLPTSVEVHKTEFSLLYIKFVTTLNNHQDTQVIPSRSGASNSSDPMRPDEGHKASLWAGSDP